MLRTLFFFGLLMFPARLNALDLIAYALPPYVYDRAGVAFGPAIDLAEELLRAADIEGEFNTLPLPRFTRDILAGDRIGVFRSRSPELEKKMQWVVTFASGQSGFVTAAPKPAPTSLKEAYGLGRIGVVRGSVSERRLGEKSLLLASAPDEATNIQALLAGRIPVWMAPLGSLDALLADQHIPRSAISIGPTILEYDYYIVASLDVPAPIIEIMQKRYRDLKANGTVQRLMAPTRPNHTFRRAD
jgi:ABC-type amino acid transport substrate-binding protein